MKVRLIREGQGPLHAHAARLLFGATALGRAVFATGARVVPGSRRARERYPRVFDVRRHWLQFLWSVSPQLVRREMPRPPDELPADARVRPESAPAGAGSSTYPAAGSHPRDAVPAPEGRR
jgi:hypothetical protein